MENNAHLIDFSAVKDAIEDGVKPDASFLKLATEANKAIDELAAQMAYEAPAASNDLTTEFEAEVAACACDTCLEEAAPDQTLDEADVALYYAEADDDLHDGLQMALEAVAELKARFEALEERITLFNVRSSHKL